MCTNGDAGCLPELFFAFEDCFCKRNGILRANLRCAFSPDETQMEQFARTIRSRYGEREIRWNVSVDPSLIGGFVLQVGDLESDWSVKDDPFSSSVPGWRSLLVHLDFHTPMLLDELCYLS